MNLANVKEQRIPVAVTREKSEWWFVAGVIVLVLGFTSLPYLFAYFSAPADKQFMGMMADVPDHLQYFSWMRELTTANLSANKLTPEPNAPVFFNLLWWGMGRIGALVGLSYAGMFQLLRFVGGALFLLLVYRVASWHLNDRPARRVAFLLVIFAGGFGWLLVLLKYTVTGGRLIYPLLLFIAEPNTFFNLLAFPHFVAAALYIFVFDLVLRGQQKNQLRYAVGAGLFALFLGWQHAYDLILVYGILGAYALALLVRDRRLPWYMIKSGLIIGLISCWPALYSVMLTSLDPVWKEVLAQFDNAGVFTPNLLQLPVLMGPAFLLAIFTLLRQNPLRLRGLDNRTVFLRTWFVANFLLIYIPTDYQIHMLNGWQVPIAILATQGVFAFIIPATQKLAQRKTWRWSPAAIRNGVLAALFVLVIPTNFYLWAWRFLDLSRHSYPYYLHQTEVQALAWLEQNVQPDDVVLSSLTVGQYVPAYSGARAFLAHWAQTVDFYGKETRVAQFYSADVPDSRRQQVVDDYSVDYIFYGPAERELGDFQPHDSPLLEPVYSGGDVEIFRVTQ